MRFEYLALILSGILSGTITPGGQFFIDRGFSLYEVSLYRALFICIILLPVVLLRRRFLIQKQMLPFYLLYGLVGGILVLFMFAGLSYGVPVAMVVLLLYTQPVWTIIIGRFVLSEPITLTKLIASLLGVSGLLILLRPWEGGSIQSNIGVICALLSGVLLSVWVILGKKSAIYKQHYITTTFGVSGFAVFWLLVSWPLMSLFISDPNLVSLSLSFSGDSGLYFFLFSLIGGVFPYMFFYRGVQGVSAAVAGIILLLEPVSATLLARIFFSQEIGFYTLVGGVFILLSNYVIIREPVREYGAAGT